MPSRQCHNSSKTRGPHPWTASDCNGPLRTDTAGQGRYRGSSTQHPWTPIDRHGWAWATLATIRLRLSANCGDRVAGDRGNFRQVISHSGRRRTGNRAGRPGRLRNARDACLGNPRREVRSPWTHSCPYCRCVSSPYNSSRRRGAMVPGAWGPDTMGPNTMGPGGVMGAGAPGRLTAVRRSRRSSSRMNMHPLRGYISGHRPSDEPIDLRLVKGY